MPIAPKHSVSAILKCGDYFILQQRDAKKGIESPGKIHFFGGAVEAFDADTEAAIRRELGEETSLDTRTLKLEKVWQGEIPGEPYNRYASYSATLYEVQIPTTDFLVYEGEGKVVVRREDIDGLGDITPFARHVIKAKNYNEIREYYGTKHN